MNADGLEPAELSLLQAARATSSRAEVVAPDRCGAMAETADGRRYPGASHHPPTCSGVGACAERVAVWTARAATEAPIVCVALWVPAGAGHHPCGACLQVLQELAPGARLVMQRGDSTPRRLDLAELLPDAFVSYLPEVPPPPAREDPTP